MVSTCLLFKQNFWSYKQKHKKNFIFPSKSHGKSNKILKIYLCINKIATVAVISLQDFITSCHRGGKPANYFLTWLWKASKIPTQKPYITLAISCWYCIPNNFIVSFFFLKSPVSFTKGNQFFSKKLHTNKILLVFFFLYTQLQHVALSHCTIMFFKVSAFFFSFLLFL